MILSKLKGTRTFNKQRPSLLFLPMFQNEYGQHDCDEDEEARDALDWPGALLVFLCLLELLDALLGVFDDLLHVEVYAVEDGALVDY